MKPHLLLYTDDLGIGGVAQFNSSLLCHLATLGYPLSHVQAKPIEPLIHRERELGIDHIWLGYHAGNDLTRTLKDINGAKTIFRQSQPQLILFSDGWPFSNLAAKQAAIELGIPYIIILGFIEPSCVRLSYGDDIPYVDVATYQYGRARSVVAVSQENLNLLQRLFHLPSHLGQVIHYGRPSQYFAPPASEVRQRLRREQGIPEDAVVCFTAARMEPIKGYQYQIAAMRQLQPTQTWSKLYFLWAGSGSECHYNNEQELKDAVAKLGTGDRVKFLGQRWDIPDLLDASDIFILPSLAEGMPLSIMEAMAKGLPVIASAVSGVPEELGDTGKLLPHPQRDPKGTVRELVTALEAWVASSQLRQSMGRACQQRAEVLFQESRMLADYTTVIENVLSSLVPARSEVTSPEIDRQFPSDLEHRLRYGSWVWEAWSAYCQGNLTMMAQCLQRSLNCSPFLKTKTIDNWISSFHQFSTVQGETLDVYRLTDLEEWKHAIDEFSILYRTLTFL